MKSVLFVYGSAGGNTRMVVETVAAFLQLMRFRVKVGVAEFCDPKALLSHDVVILASPTYGHGSLESTMAKFAVGLKAIALKGKPCAVIGLGDPKYEAQYHLESAAILEKVLIGAGGKILLTALRISGNPVQHLKGFVASWSEQLAKKLKEL